MPQLHHNEIYIYNIFFYYKVNFKRNIKVVSNTTAATADL